MNIYCKNCGTKVDVGNALAEGAEVRCPACGTMIARARNTARVSMSGVPEHPVEVVNPGNVEESGIEQRSETGKTRQDTIKLRRTLHLKPEPPPPPRRLHDSEIRLQMYEQMKHKMWRRKFLQNVFEVAVLIGLLFSGWFIYKGVDAHLQHKRELAAAERVAEQERECQEAEFRQKEREAEEARRQAELNERKKLAAAEAQARENERKERAETAETYKIFTYALRENEFDLFCKSVTNDIGAADFEMCYLLPTDENDLNYYMVLSRTNQQTQVFKINQLGDKIPFDYDLFCKRLDTMEYLVAKQGKVYYRPRRTKPLWGRLNKAAPCDPAGQFFGGMAKTIAKLGPEYDDLTFDIVFFPKNSKKPIVSETLEFGCAYSIENMLEAVGKAFPPSGYISGKFKSSKFKRTTKLWNGSLIKKGIDGITYVPRTRPTDTYRTHLLSSNISGYRTIYTRYARENQNSANWQTLYDQAVKEDAEEEEFYRRQKDEFLSKHEKGMSDAERAYKRKLDDIIDKGELYFHAKKRKK